MFATMILGSFPLFKFYYAATNDIHVWPIDILVGCVELVSYFVHFGFLLTHRRYGGLSHRGPLFLGVVWCVLFLLSVVWIFEGTQWRWSFVVVVMHIIYAVSLIPSGDARLITLNQIQHDVRKMFLDSSFGFKIDL